MQVRKLLIGLGADSGKHNKQYCKQCDSNYYQSTYFRQLISIQILISHCHNMKEFCLNSSQPA